MKTIRRLWILPLLAALLLGACGGLLTSDQPPRQVYLLQPSPANDGDNHPAVRVSVTAVPGLDTDRILALEPDARLSPYANARWADHLPEVLGSVLQRSLEPPAANRTANSTADYAMIDLELRAFYGVRSAAGVTSSVRTELAGTLSCGGRTFDLRLSAKPRVAEERLAAVVAAHQRALDEMTDDLRDRLLAACSGRES